MCSEQCQLPAPAPTCPVCADSKVPAPCLRTLGRWPQVGVVPSSARDHKMTLVLSSVLVMGLPWGSGPLPHGQVALLLLLGRKSLPPPLGLAPMAHVLDKPVKLAP